MNKLDLGLPCLFNSTKDTAEISNIVEKFGSGSKIKEDDRSIQQRGSSNNDGDDSSEEKCDWDLGIGGNMKI